MLCVIIADQSKAYPLKSVLAAKLIQGQVGGLPLLIIVGPDGTSVRIFNTGTLGGSTMTFTSIADAAMNGSGYVMRDAETGSDWDFQGRARSGKLTGQCLQALDSNKDYWFDWLNHHPKRFCIVDKGAPMPTPHRKRPGSSLEA